MAGHTLNDVLFYGRDFLHNIRIRLKGERSLLAAGRTVVIV